MEIDWSPLWLSLRVATLSTLAAVVAGTALAWLLAARRTLWRDLLDAAVTLPLVLPPTVLGYYLLVVLGRNSSFGALYEQITGSPLVFTWQAAVVAAWFHSAPLLVKAMRAAFESVDPSLLKAAHSLGASEWRTFHSIALPLTRGPLLSAAALAWARALGDFGVTIMIAGNIPGRTQTVAVAIYEAVESGNGMLARALVVAISAIALATVALTNRWAFRMPS